MLFNRSLKLQTKIMLLTFAVVAAALLITNILISQNIEFDAQKGTARKAASVAHLIVKSPLVIEGLAQDKNIDAMQTYANESGVAAEVEYIVILDMQGIRKSHPNFEKIGQQFVGGDEEDALAGKEYVSVAKGTLGDALRAFVPVFTPEGKQVGVVVVGVLMDNIKILEKETQKALFLAIIIGMMIGIIGAYLLSKNVKNILFGLEPEAIANRLEERNAMLQSVYEGILAVDSQGVITLVNAETIRILGLTGIDDSPVGKSITNYVPNTNLLEVIESGVAQVDQEQDFHGSPVIANCLPMIVNGKVVGAISTFRDKTEVKDLAEQLTGVQDYVDALRARAHEFMNQLHVILGLVKLKSYSQLANYINKITSEHEEEISFVTKRIREPLLAGFILSKLSLSRENNVIMHLAEETYVPKPWNNEVIHEMVTIIGNLVENAFDAVNNSPYKEIELHMYYDKGILSIHVSDTGEGILPEVSSTLFKKGISSKEGNRGFGLHLVQCSLERLGGTIDFESRPGEGTIFMVNIPYEIKKENE
ncbi:MULTISPECIES: DcuS/MalK family sensor histidine kinase [Pelosinus]|uniref:histidine kinase n=2 Tax=Pelosinus TaxID=365348 RepID=I9NQE7_9FIRM|nr:MULTISPECIES: DcuS/MalK family sensor histidine kinase [Pelosinus]AJQ28249.1 signal transduction histidine kinase regulating citrate/malate metabolism [Pelosinus fermentans JBW45]MCC5465163.1 DcuS/MalK family sensor histidine kinase [Pelosinus baikalensis]MCC5465222.1 DcuS/MalK family sensor histidine kinase [Pelosinus baikalensis]